jgi:hypothetical protein
MAMLDTFSGILFQLHIPHLTAALRKLFRITHVYSTPRESLRAERFPPLTLGLLLLRRQSLRPEAVAARAADIASLCSIMQGGLNISAGTG